MISKLEKYRKEKKISYYTLGQQLGFTGINPAVSCQRYASSDRFPRPKILIRIRELTGITADEMLDDWQQKNK